MELGRFISGPFLDRAASVFRFYMDGFHSMVLGKTLWKIILIKLFVFFAVFKLFFFPDFLETRYENDADRAGHVLNQLVLNSDYGAGVDHDLSPK